MTAEFYCNARIREFRTDWPTQYEELNGIVGADFKLFEEPDTVAESVSTDTIGKLRIPVETVPERGLYEGAQYRLTVQYEEEERTPTYEYDDTSLQITLPAMYDMDKSMGHVARLEADDIEHVVRTSLWFPFPDEPWFQAEGDECFITLDMEYDQEMTKERFEYGKSFGNDGVTFTEEDFEEFRKEAKAKLESA